MLEFLNPDFKVLKISLSDKIPMKEKDIKEQWFIDELEKLCRRLEGKKKSGAVFKRIDKGILDDTEKPFRQVDRQNDGIAIIQDGLIKFVNPGSAAKSGDTMSAYVLFKVLELYRKYIAGGEVTSNVELEILNKKGEKNFLKLNMNLIPYRGKLAELIIIHDVTGSKELEEKLILSLKEKEAMMRELHHRVKNNMQIISSLLRLQSRHLKNQKIIEMFRASQTRIRSMALVHEKLYISENLARINFVRYIENLGAYLFHSYKVDMSRVKFIVNAEDIFLEIKTAIPLGLIVNELVSNSLRHAFPDGRKGEIAVSIRFNKRSEIILEVSDTGVGVTEKWDFHRAKTLGMQLVADLVKQIDGAIELKRDRGTAFTVSFHEAK